MNGKLPKILLVIVAAAVSLPFVGGLYAIGPIEFPCTYQQVQGKKTLKKLESDVQGLRIAGNGPSKTNKSTSLDCLDGSLNNPITVSATFNLTSPVSLTEAETAVLANQQIKKPDEQRYKAAINLGSVKEDPRMRQVTISDVETNYGGTENARYKVRYNLQSSVACTPPTPPESKLDDSRCRSETAFSDFGIDKQPIRTIAITRSEIPAQN